MLSGYYYPNEAAAPLLWQPVLFAYTLLISGADLLILAALAYLSGSLRKAVPLMTMLGIGFFAVVLLGPLADLGSPQRAHLMFLNPHLASTPVNPGVSLIAVQGLAWAVGLVLAALFAVLTFSYYSHQAALTASGVRRMVFRIFSLNITTAERYSSAEKTAKAIAVAMLLPMTMWGMYPASMLLTQTWNPVWRSWTLLPVVYFADTFVVATAIFVLVYYFWRRKALERDVLVPVLKIHAAGSISVAALTALQMAVWYLWSPSTAEMTSPLMPLMYLVIVFLMLSFFVSIVAIRYPFLSPAVSLIAFAGTFANKWNILINAQLVSKTGLALFEAELHGQWLLETVSPIAAGLALFLILSIVFPLEVRVDGQ
ncbi:MAG: hypothetical protein NZ570_06455 [Candidatus Caldarchaeum sp.]|nr:hypothetical protein [Candidatus Caldarchaeum sp.]MDW8359704.1 hypothetical protein [Candidatus Caldarchaeum sp.]